MDDLKLVYLFWHQRPTDKQAWPVVYTNFETARDCKYRVSELEEVYMPLTHAQMGAKRTQALLESMAQVRAEVEPGIANRILRNIWSRFGDVK